MSAPARLGVSPGRGSDQIHLYPPYTPLPFQRPQVPRSTPWPPLLRGGWHKAGEAGLMTGGVYGSAFLCGLPPASLCSATPPHKCGGQEDFPLLRVYVPPGHPRPPLLRGGWHRRQAVTGGVYRSTILYGLPPASLRSATPLINAGGERVHPASESVHSSGAPLGPRF